MKRAWRDRIRYPATKRRRLKLLIGNPSLDTTISSRRYICSIFDSLGGLIDAMQKMAPQDFSGVIWDQLVGVPDGISSSPATVANFVIDKANCISNAYGNAMKRYLRNKYVSNHRDVIASKMPTQNLSGQVIQKTKLTPIILHRH